MEVKAAMELAIKWMGFKLFSNKQVLNHKLVCFQQNSMIVGLYWIKTHMIINLCVGDIKNWHVARC